mmetsp:Transcript_6620/g.18908  ORF Transcript_6620/g.18908 Transcript_6620/m.18908 type:complete len:205 (-) Transcript_6620:1285-1899(-)
MQSCGASRDLRSACASGWAPFVRLTWRALHDLLGHLGQIDGALSQRIAGLRLPPRVLLEGLVMPAIFAGDRVARSGRIHLETGVRHLDVLLLARAHSFARGFTDTAGGGPVPNCTGLALPDRIDVLAKVANMASLGAMCPNRRCPNTTSALLVGVGCAHHLQQVQSCSVGPAGRSLILGVHPSEGVGAPGHIYTDLALRSPLGL